jgi:hypothetical protein
MASARLVGIAMKWETSILPPTKVEKYLGKRVTCQIIRISFVTYFLESDPSKEQKEEISKLMGHSLLEQMYYDKSQQKYIKKDIHTELLKSDESFKEEEVVVVIFILSFEIN